MFLGAALVIVSVVYTNGVLVEGLNKVYCFTSHSQIMEP